jgi:hypothetical protein
MSFDPSFVVDALNLGADRVLRDADLTCNLSRYSTVAQQERHATLGPRKSVQGPQQRVGWSLRP